MFTVELPREIGSNGLFYTQKHGKDRISFLEASAIKGKSSIAQKYGKDRISFLSVAFVRGKREIAQKYGKDRKYWIEKPLPREKPLTRFDSYMGIESIS